VNKKKQKKFDQFCSVHNFVVDQKANLTKVFWFFFTKKKRFPYRLSCHF